MWAQDEINIPPGDANSAAPSFGFGPNFFEPKNGEASTFSGLTCLFADGAAEPEPKPKPKPRRRTKSVPPIHRDLDNSNDGRIGGAGERGHGFRDTLNSGDFVAPKPSAAAVAPPAAARPRDPRGPNVSTART